MKITWKEIKFSFFNFFMNPMEKYEIHIKIISMLICLSYYIHGNIKVIGFSNAIIYSFPVILKSYQQYKKNFKSIDKKTENTDIKDISIFPSGKIIVITCFYIKIYDINFNVKQMIADGLHYIFISIKDENNFLVYSNNKIFFYESINNLDYSLSGKIQNLSNLISAFFFAKKYLLCLSKNEIKIFEKKFLGDYEMINIIKDSGIKSCLYLEIEKILISSGENGTYLRKFKKLDLIKKYEIIKCEINNGIENIGNNRIVILTGWKIFVISITKRDIIKLFDFNLRCDVVHAVKGANILLIAFNNSIFTYRKDNLKYLETSITDSNIEIKYKKIIGINNEKYLYIFFDDNNLYISKY